MTKYQIAADTIKQTVSALDVANVLGWEVRHGRCRCPIHGGKDFNFRLYPGNRGYMCWVCKSAGDVISLVRNYYSDMSYRQCIAWFDATFRLNLDIEGKIDQQKQKQAEIAIQRRKKAREMLEWKERMQFNLYLLAERLVDRLENDRDDHRPRTYGEWDERFYTSVRLLPEARRFAEDCMIDCTKQGSH